MGRPKLMKTGYKSIKPNKITVPDEDKPILNEVSDDDDE
jgi:hypothetical protein